jgi:hypothetical protein
MYTASNIHYQRRTVTPAYRLIYQGVQVNATNQPADWTSKSLFEFLGPSKMVLRW